MKSLRFWLVIVVMACVGTGTFWIARITRPHAPAKHEHAGPRGEVAWMKTTFHLTDEQFRKVEALHVDYVPRCEENCRRIENAGAKVRKLLETSRATNEEIAEAVRQEETVRTECRLALIAHLYETAAAMPPRTRQEIPRIGAAGRLPDSPPRCPRRGRPLIAMQTPSDLPVDPDDACMARLAAGEDRALDELMHRWSARLISFLVRITGNHATSCDLAQESFVRLYQARDRFKPGGTFGSFLFQIAANLAKNHTRWQQRHPEISIDEGTMPEPGDTTRATPDQDATARETAEAVRRAVLELPEELRVPLVLSVYEGRGQDEIAAILGCSRKAVEMRVYRARQVLRDRLAQFLDA